MKTIPLTKNKVAVVDDADYLGLMAHKWAAMPARRGSNWYAVRTAILNGRKKSVLMHREILNPGDGVEVDHRDGNGLNNQRLNLRKCSHAENTRNVGKKSKTGRFKGVWPEPTKTGMRWRAVIHQGRKGIQLGVFDTELAAAAAYDEAATRLHGEFARLNLTAR